LAHGRSPFAVRRRLLIVRHLWSVVDGRPSSVVRRHSSMLNPKSKIDMTHQPITILLSGAPGVGKTAIQRLTPRFFRARGIEAAAMGTDDIYTIIDPDWSDPNQRRRDITRANCILLAQNLFQHGVGVVLICGNALYSEQLTQDYVIQPLACALKAHSSTMLRLCSKQFVKI
jgi:hypothetical protein